MPSRRHRRGAIYFDATIRSGLPVEVEAIIYPPEPDVGIFHEQVEITSITFPRRRLRSGRLAKAYEVPEHMISRADREALETLALESAE